jgi:hypothetical protein
MGREYFASHHAQARLQERYAVALTAETWAALVRDIETWPWTLSDIRAGGREHREAWIRLEGETGALVVPMIYTVSRSAVVIRTVLPGGFRLARKHHAAAHP